MLENINNFLLKAHAWFISRHAFAKEVLKNEEGHEWIDTGLKILILSIPLAAAGIGVATVIITKYDGLKDVLENVKIPIL